MTKRCGGHIEIEYPEPYIKMSDGRVSPKRTCDLTPCRDCTNLDYKKCYEEKRTCSTDTTNKSCVDCTFLDRKECYEEADKLGFINKNVGWGRGQRLPSCVGEGCSEEPLEYECPRRKEQNAGSHHWGVRPSSVPFRLLVVGRRRRTSGSVPITVRPASIRPLVIFRNSASIWLMGAAGLLR